MIDWKTVQAKIGCEPDGQPGPKTYAALLAYVAQRPVNPTLAALGVGMAAQMPAYGITTISRLANFIGQSCHETEGYRFMREIWGPTPAQVRYEGRADLGNTVAGDGHRYLGRGIFQLTGRANYASMGKRIGVDLEGNPGIAEQPDIAVHTACEFWKAKGLEALADAGQDDAVTRKINGGTNGIDKRRTFVARAKAVLS